MLKYLSCVLFMLTGLPLMAAELGDDGLHKAPWIQDTFKDLREDLGDANAEGKRLMVMIKQRGCIYCTKMHEEVFPLPHIASYITDNYFVVQINMFGDIEVTNFDVTVLAEKEMVKKWGVLFTPTILFLSEDVAVDTPANKASIATMPGAFGPGTTFDMLNWVVVKGYDKEESFQKYHARKVSERNN